MRNRNAWSVTRIVLGMFSLTCIPSLCLADESEGMIAHDVYFTLADDSLPAQKTLIAACQKHLSGHPGTIWFAAGPLAKELQGDLNDRDFGVALHLVFENKAALEQYGTSERHQQFLKEMQSQWTKVTKQGEGDGARFVKIVHVGEDVTLDVAHKDGEVLTLLELTEVQRERIKAAATEK